MYAYIETSCGTNMYIFFAHTHTLSSPHHLPQTLNKTCHVCALNKSFITNLFDKANYYPIPHPSFNIKPL